MLKQLWENWKKNDNEVDDDVTQLERSNNKCYVSAFRYIQIYIYKIFILVDDYYHFKFLFQNIFVNIEWNLSIIFTY